MSRAGTENHPTDDAKEEIRTQRSSSIDSESLTDADVGLIEAELGSTESQDSNVPISQLHTTVLTPTHDLAPVEGFDGTEVTLEQLNDAIAISNDMFEGAMKFMIRDNPFCTYEFNGDKDVLWEIQIQVCKQHNQFSFDSSYATFLFHDFRLSL
jgi:hypothetical protein